MSWKLVICVGGGQFLVHFTRFLVYAGEYGMGEETVDDVVLVLVISRRSWLPASMVLCCWYSSTQL